jgi:NADH dehydrogenase
MRSLDNFVSEATSLDVVTGAFGYTGKYIARRLLACGRNVLTLTGHPGRANSSGDRVAVAPFHFEDRRALVRSLRGATTLYNTYWVRFPHGPATYEKAVENTKALIGAALEAGVRRMVHVSIANPSADSPLPYYRGKSVLENVLRESGLSYAILRPTVIFGPEDILINNIAWFLRKFPVFGVPGSGEYQVQPIFVEDMAELAVQAGLHSDNTILDAVGPETFTFNELVRLVAEKIKRPARILHVRPATALWFVRLVGWFVRDVVLTPEEIEGLLSNLLVTPSPSTGRTHLSDWLGRHADQVGIRYASELRRHYS